MGTFIIQTSKLWAPLLSGQLNEGKIATFSHLSSIPHEEFILFLFYFSSRRQSMIASEI